MHTEKDVAKDQICQLLNDLFITPPKDITMRLRANGNYDVSWTPADGF